MATPAEVACEAAEKFVELYHDIFDKSRHVISNLYSDDAKFISKRDEDGGDVVTEENLEILNLVSDDEDDWATIYKSYCTNTFNTFQLHEIYVLIFFKFMLLN